MPVLALTLLVLCNIKKVLVRPQVTGCMPTSFPNLPSLSFLKSQPTSWKKNLLFLFIFDTLSLWQAFDAFIYIFFALEMVIKMVALGIFGRRCYLGDTWNRLDFFIVMAGWEPSVPFVLSHAVCRGTHVTVNNDRFWVHTSCKASGFTAQNEAIRSAK